jgi:hypothetical protein
MADIDIVPKRRTGSAWLWIVIAIVVIALLWLAFGRGGHTQTGALIETGAPLLAATARALLMAA